MPTEILAAKTQLGSKKHAVDEYETERQRKLEELKVQLEKDRSAAASAKTMSHIIYMYMVICFIAYWSASYKSIIGGMQPGTTMGFNDFKMPAVRAFPEYYGASKGTQLHLVAAGMRKKFGVVPIYSLGFYISSTKKQQIQQARSLSSLAKSTSKSYDLGLLLNFEREVIKEKAIKAIVDSLGGSHRGSKLTKALNQFSQTLHDQIDTSVKQGDSIEFSYTDKNRIGISFNNQSVEFLESEDLRWRLVNIYAGDKSVVPEVQTILLSLISEA